ncbi:uncharacterized protein [Lolium perenne]|uniref:uncharacterized protein n=1 Tax=Lolium perenne TaxID=4522 RepID=UPI003A99E00A
MWVKHDQFKPFLDESWQAEGKAVSMQQLQQKLSRISGSLESWGRDTFGSVQREVRSLTQRLAVLRDVPLRQELSDEEVQVTRRLIELYNREELMWRQRSRVQWLSEGDKNTRFFHLRASQRKKKNKISRLTRLDGTMTVEEDEMAYMTRTFYEQLYQTEGISNLGEVIDVIPVKVTSVMNDCLLKPFKEEEVKNALFQMFPTKAPGPDGFPAHFFQTHWELCGEEVTSAVIRVLKGEDDMRDINQTFLVLIPKVASPKELGQFRPISLCNVIYKITSKVLANRLKGCLPEIIAEEQSAFVPGWLITDNIITAYECLHFIKRNRAKKHRFCALKLDMRKAYDRLEWRYLEAVMLKLGFHRLWVQMVMRLVTTVSFQRINRDKSSIFFSKGCPGTLKDSVKLVLDVQNETLNEKYLGMPTDVGRSRSSAFKYIKDRIWSKIQGWLEKLLQGWRMLKNPNTLSARVLKARYYPVKELLSSEVGAAPSQIWRSIHEGLQVLKQGLIRRIGDGESTDPWNEPWIPRDGMLRP